SPSPSEPQPAPFGHLPMPISQYCMNAAFSLDEYTNWSHDMQPETPWQAAVPLMKFELSWIEYVFFFLPSVSDVTPVTVGKVPTVWLMSSEETWAAKSAPLPTVSGVTSVQATFSQVILGNNA